MKTGFRVDRCFTLLDELDRFEDEILDRRDDVDEDDDDDAFFVALFCRRIIAWPFVLFFDDERPFGAGTGDVYFGIGSDGADDACADGTLFTVVRSKITPIVTEKMVASVAAIEFLVSEDFLNANFIER